MRGFTIIELLLVVAVIAVLAGLGYPAMLAIQRRNQRIATDTVVQACATAVRAYQGSLWTAVVDHDGDPATTDRAESWRLWDANGDGLLDGDPTAGEAGPPALAPALTASGYPGFLALARPALPARHRGRDGRVLDGWRRPLRIAFAVYGTERFGIWSAGADGLDGTADDHRSWSATR